MERPVKNNLIISPKNRTIKGLKECQYFSSTKGTTHRGHTAKQSLVGSVSVKNSQFSRNESGYSKQMATRMAEHMLDASFSK